MCFSKRVATTSLEVLHRRNYHWCDLGASSEFLDLSAPPLGLFWFYLEIRRSGRRALSPGLKELSHWLFKVILHSCFEQPLALRPHLERDESNLLTQPWQPCLEPAVLGIRWSYTHNGAVQVQDPHLHASAISMFSFFPASHLRSHSWWHVHI